MAVQIQSFKRVVPMIYAYNTPGVVYHDGWTKIGYTEKQTPAQRVKQQTHTADIRHVLAWQDNAMYKDGSGEYFTDREFHSFLESGLGVERTLGTEWFHVDGPTSHDYFERFARREIVPEDGEKLTYALRKEQETAVSMTKAYFEDGGEEFLWNAKPRFGKTLAAYDLVRQMGLTKVLIVTNRPSIANSWAEDFFKFIGWRGEFVFVSDTDALRGRPGVLSREEFVSASQRLGENMPKCMVAFESLQGLKGSVYFGGEYDKLKWMSELEFDLLVVDEAQEGVDTIRTERAFREIHRKHTLYLSGTPFKALASEQFSKEQIYNWSYADEQEAKATWNGEDENPYEPLPRLAMFTYQLSGMIRERIEKGLDLSEEEGTIDYAFDLNEFFATDEKGNFIHEEEIKKFLHALTTQEKYPFSTPELRQELSHTMWYLNRVASVRALKKLLEADEVFGEYEIVAAVGDGRGSEDEQAEKAIDKVKAAIAEHEKTITLTVGQLTVGVTIPEWSGVTEADFRFLRDGGDYVDPETGETQHFEGHLFDEVVFNDSVEVFWGKKQQLANYFDESQDEDIFDYIPPQKTNQIFTPKWVVSMMVDQLEENDPGCFDDPDKTFADLYMKSGLYITEIVKRLYRSEGLKAVFPDDKERIRHILQKQVYGMAPTRIIYLIATNYILGFDDELKKSAHNFVEADAAEAAKQGTLAELVDTYFGA